MSTILTSRTSVWSDVDSMLSNFIQLVLLISAHFSHCFWNPSVSEAAVSAAFHYLVKAYC